MDCIEIAPDISPNLGRVELATQFTELVELHGRRVVDHIQGPENEQVALDILSTKAVVDMNPNELIALQLAALHWALPGALKQSEVIRQAVRAERTPEWLGLASFVQDETMSHVSDLASDFDNIGGEEMTRSRITEQNALSVGTALTSTVFEEIAGSNPRKRHPIRTLLKLAGDTYTGLVLVGADGKDLRKTKNAIGLLEHAKIEALNPSDQNKYTLFTRALVPLSRRAARLYDRHYRAHDIDSSVTDVAKRTTEMLRDFVLTADEEFVDLVLSSEDHLNTVVEYLVREVDKAGQVSFGDVANDGLMAANEGRAKYRKHLGAIYWERGEEKVDSVPASQNRKSEIFDAYTPEMHKISIIMGGTYDDTRRVYEAAADLLETLYMSADQDEVDLPTFGDFYLIMASYLGVGPFYKANASISALSPEDKRLLHMQLELFHDANLANQKDADANCFGVDPEIFFPPDNKSTVHGIRVCNDCNETRKDRCLFEGLSEYHGVWAGLSMRERAKIRKARNMPELEELEPEEDDTTEVVVEITSHHESAGEEPINDDDGNELHKLEYEGVLNDDLVELESA